MREVQGTGVTPLRVTVLTALPIETKSLLEQLESSRPTRIGDSVGHVGLLRDTAQPAEFTIVEVGPGNIETAMEAGRVRGEGTAEILMFVGIAGALKDLALGDVVAASEVVWLHRAKIEAGRELRRQQLQPCTRELVQEARYTAQAGAWISRVSGGSASPRAVVGQILSGEELVKDRDYKKTLQADFSDALAVENEGYALANAGGPGLKVIVIRGASDHADEGKRDKDQALAARHAAAFAAELINNHLILRSPVSASPPSEHFAAQAGEPAAAVTTTAFDRAATALESLRTDADLMSEDPSSVIDFANTDFASADVELRNAMVELLVTEIDDEQSGFPGERLRVYTRAFVARLMQEPDLRRPDWDELLRQSSIGTSVALAQAVAFTQLNPRERRRVLSGLIGNAGTPRTATPIGWTFILDLLRADVFDDSERVRVHEAILATSYSTLYEAGATPTELLPKLAYDLESHDYGAQNRAARFLLSADSPHLDSGQLQAADRARIASLLISAAAGGAWGAKDATSRSVMAGWDVQTLAGALWAALTRGSDRLDMPTDRLPDVLAAATLGGKLTEVLDAVLSSVAVEEQLAPIKDSSVKEDREWLVGRAQKLPDVEAQKQWLDFLTELFKRVPRE